MRKKNTFGANRSTEKCRSIYIFGRSIYTFYRASENPELVYSLRHDGPTDNRITVFVTKKEKEEKRPR